MRLTLSMIFAALPGMAAAHFGHFDTFAGHDHWVAGAAIGAAVAVGIWGALKGKDKDAEGKATDKAADKTEAEGDDAPEPQEA